ncbi:MAG: fibrobacter succinogenes major paralogous domain-containing protein, partial [Fibrobacteraceae bacterium]|nr:fibrobacter succinogenes major paralogous domain-containing protein [Fibrobacteraceae bacterium]
MKYKVLDQSHQILRCFFSLASIAIVGACSDGGTSSLNTAGSAFCSSSEAVVFNPVMGSSASVIESSSSVATSSSSAAASSSGAVSSPSHGFVDPSTVVTGTLLDSRDGQVYKTVKIGTQTWMAENLNYTVENPHDPLDYSWCYDNRTTNCEKYGRLYTWTAVMDVTGSIQMNPKGICPDNWHVPTEGEWATLATAVGGLNIAGTALKTTSGWKERREGISGNGTDSYGFSAFPAGIADDGNNFFYAGECAYFWSASERN